MKTILIAFVALAISTPAVAAGPTTFTFTSTNGPTTTLGDGNYVGASYSGTMTTTWSDGKKSSSTFTCVATSNPPHDSIFRSTTVCDGKSAEGNFTSIWGCNPVDKDGKVMGCVGGLSGQTGIYANRRGAATFSGDAVGGVGTGQWRD